MSMDAATLALARGYLADPGTNAVQSIQIENAVGGTWTITFSGQTTAALDFDAGANDVQNAFCALSNVGVGNANVVEQTGVPGSLFYAIYFVGDLANAAQAMLTVTTTSLTGTGIIVTILQATAGGVTAFTDDELDALYSQANTDLFLTVSYGYRWLKANGAKFNDYVAGQSQEKKGQIFDHLSELADDFERLSISSSGQVQFTRLMGVPPRTRAYPVQPGVPMTSLATRPPFRWRRNGSGDGWGNW